MINVLLAILIVVLVWALTAMLGLPYIASSGSDRTGGDLPAGARAWPGYQWPIAPPGTLVLKRGGPGSSPGPLLSHINFFFFFFFFFFT